MQEAKLFMNGRSQAVRLPKEFRFKGDRVGVRQVSQGVLLIPLDSPQAPWDAMFDAAAGFSADYMNEREEPPVQERDWNP